MQMQNDSFAKCGNNLEVSTSRCQIPPIILWIAAETATGGLPCITIMTCAQLTEVCIFSRDSISLNSPIQENQTNLN